METFVDKSVYDQYMEYDGYFCIQTAPFLCSCRTKPWTFIHFDRDIVVWEDKDDDTLLSAASEFKKIGLDPHIIMYNALMGSCIAWVDMPAGAIIG